VANENRVPPKPPINGAAANTSRMNSVDQSTLAPSASSGAPPIRHRGRSPTVGKANTGNLADWATSRGGGLLDSRENDRSGDLLQARHARSSRSYASASHRLFLSLSACDIGSRSRTAASGLCCRESWHSFFYWAVVPFVVAALLTTRALGAETHADSFDVAN
jgi:hypothetical protein